MNKIQDMIERLIGVEGRYAFNRNDAGGETMWGITARVARANGYNGDMIAMTKEAAAEIYLREYFVNPGFDKVFLISPSIAEELFDTGVNMGVGVSCRFLQRCLNVLNKSHTSSPAYQELIVDGSLGAKSQVALTTFLKTRGSQGEVVLLRMLNALQGARYIEITEERVQNEDFIYGWFLNRVVI